MNPSGWHRFTLHVLLPSGRTGGGLGGLETQGTESSKSGAEYSSLGCSACVVEVQRTCRNGAAE